MQSKIKFENEVKTTSVNEGNDCYFSENANKQTDLSRNDLTGKQMCLKQTSKPRIKVDQTGTLLRFEHVDFYGEERERCQIANQILIRVKGSNIEDMCDIIQDVCETKHPDIEFTFKLEHSYIDLMFEVPNAQEDDLEEYIKLYDKLCAEIRSIKGVKSVSPNSVVDACSTLQSHHHDVASSINSAGGDASSQNDCSYRILWSQSLIKQFNRKFASLRGKKARKPVTIAILDDGVDFHNNELWHDKLQLWSSSQTLPPNEKGMFMVDPTGHGTTIVGSIVGKDKGVISRENLECVSIHMCNITCGLSESSKSPTASVKSLVKGIRQVCLSGASVVNMS